MAYAISLWFDQADEEPIRAIWRQLHELRLSSFLSEGNFRPHITLAIYEELDVSGFVNALGTLTAGIVPFVITLPSIGVFSAPPVSLVTSANAVFLSVTPTKHLLELHSTIHRALAEFGRSSRPYYLPDRWNPHSTVAREVPSDRVPPIIEVCQNISLPISVRVDRIGVIDTPAEVELASCRLGVTG